MCFIQEGPEVWGARLEPLVEWAWELDRSIMFLFCFFLNWWLFCTSGVRKFYPMLLHSTSLFLIQISESIYPRSLLWYLKSLLTINLKGVKGWCFFLKIPFLCTSGHRTLCRHYIKALLPLLLPSSLNPPPKSNTLSLEANIVWCQVLRPVVGA